MQTDREEPPQSGIFIRWKINSLDLSDLRQSDGDLSSRSLRIPKECWKDEAM